MHATCWFCIEGLTTSKKVGTMLILPKLTNFPFLQIYQIAPVRLFLDNCLPFFSKWKEPTQPLESKGTKHGTVLLNVLKFFTLDSRSGAWRSRSTFHILLFQSDIQLLLLSATVKWQIDKCQGRFVASMFPRKHFDQNDSKLRQGSLQSDEKQEAKTQNTSNFLVSLCFPAFNLKTEGHHSFCWDFGKV